MAMALAVKSSPEATTRRQLHRLGVDSLLGTVYVLGSAGIVFYLLPAAWHWLGLSTDSPILYALLALVMLVVATGLVIGGSRLVGPTPPHGLRAGIFLACVGVLVACLIGSGVGMLLEQSAGLIHPTVGVAITAVVFVALLAGLAFAFLSGRVEKWMILLEDQGWFSAQPYKRSQGQRVRRATILGVLVLAGCGIWSLINHRNLGSGGSWEIPIPYTGQVTVQNPGSTGLVAGQVVDQATFLKTNREIEQAAASQAQERARLQEAGQPLPVTIRPLTPATGLLAYQSLTLLPQVQFTLPILLSLLALWLAYRVVNFPAFADFLIATEAEMNKVSWSTRPRLINDTIVVLIATLLLTVFLFVVDVAWSQLLSRIGIIQLDTQTAAEINKPHW
jgi:preprotein translocase SecE subunit